MSSTVEDQQETGPRNRIMGMPIPWFFGALVIVVGASLLDALPNEIIGGFAATMLIGALLWWIGERIPVLGNYGLPTILAILVPPILVFFGLFPEPLRETIETFTSDSGFLNFYVASLIAGSILGMPRQLLLKAGARYAVPLLGMVILVLASVGAVSAAIGYGFKEGVLYIAGPILGGGIGAGAVPISEMYASQMGGEPGTYLTQIVPAVVLGNVVCIILAGVIKGISGNRQFFYGFNGHGNLVRVDTEAHPEFTVKPRSKKGSFSALAIGLAIAGTLFIAGNIIESFVPVIHAYAWTILLAAALKIFGLLPQQFEDAVSDWYSFVAETLTAALLVGIGIAYLDIAELLSLLGSASFLVLIVLTVVLAGIFAGFLGWLVKFYFVESAVSVGFGMTDMGGTGDVAVLSAADRLELMPFLQISSRLGGALMLLLLSLLISVLA